MAAELFPQERQQFFHQFGRQALGFLGAAGAAVEGFRLQQQFAVLVQDAVAKVHAHALQQRGPDFNRQPVVVARGGFVFQSRFDDGENRVRVLQFQNRRAERAEKFPARRLQQIEIAGMVDVVADGAFGVGDAVVVTERFGHARRLADMGEVSR